MPFFKVGSVSGQHLTGVFHDLETGWLFLSNTEFYDADKNNKNFVLAVWPDGSNQQPWYDVENRQFAAGQILKTPSSLIDKVGGRLYMHGEHWLNIISRFSTGPSLHGWSPQIPDDSGRLALTEHMYYPHTQTVGQHGVSGCGVPANPIFNRLSRYEVSFFWEPTNSYISIGLNAGQGRFDENGDAIYAGIWYGDNNSNKGNHTCDPAGLDDASIGNDRSNYFWITDLDDIWDAKNPWEPVPIEWGYLNPTLTVPPGWIIGAYFDPDTNLLYLLSHNQQLRVYRAS